MEYISQNLGYIALASGILLLAAYAYVTNPSAKGLALFAYNCFLKPISKSPTSQQVALESFYKGQANIYDNTRSRLLQGRKLVLQLCSAHLKTQNGIWVDVCLTFIYI